MNTAEHTLPIDARVIALNETEHYNIEPEHYWFIKEIRGIYLYNKNEVTCLCEITPSYYLIHLYDRVILNEDGNKLDDSKKDEIFETYEQSGESDNIYVHCYQIDQIESSTKSEEFRYHVYGKTEVGYEDSSYDEQIEGLIEHFNNNPIL